MVPVRTFASPMTRTSARTISLRPPGSDLNAPSFVRSRSLGSCAAKRAQQAAVCPLGLREAREQRLERQAIDVAGVDAGQQRLGEVSRSLPVRIAGA